MTTEQIKADLAAANARAEKAEAKRDEALALRTVYRCGPDRSQDEWEEYVESFSAAPRELKARAEKAEAERDEAVALLREASQDVQRGWASLGCACLAGPLYDQILALLARIDAAKGGE
jgi:DNA-binding SARP family transcriptional activator